MDVNTNICFMQSESGAASSHSTRDDDDGGSDHDDPTDLGYFEPLDSDDSDDSIQQYEVYRIAGNFGEVFNLAIWRILYRSPN